MHLVHLFMLNIIEEKNDLHSRVIALETENHDLKLKLKKSAIKALWFMNFEGFGSLIFLVFQTHRMK